MKQLKRCNERCGCKTYTGFPRRTKEINRFKEKLIIAMIDKKKEMLNMTSPFFLHQCLVKENHNFI